MRTSELDHRNVRQSEIFSKLLREKHSQSQAPFVTLKKSRIM